MGKVQEILIGHRTFAVDSDWKRWEEERCNQLRCQKFDAWSEKWITVYQLKNSRLWPDAPIRRWPSVPLQQGKGFVNGMVASHLLCHSGTINRHSLNGA
ncbi:hypothetical protein V6128_28855, partial [Klebsiella pneumoniae]